MSSRKKTNKLKDRDDLDFSELTVSEDEFDDEEPFDHLLAQQELEDFEQADEYFGHYGDVDF